jgi:hypothetical protein
VVDLPEGPENAIIGQKMEIRCAQYSMSRHFLTEEALTVVDNNATKHKQESNAILL